MIKKVIIASQNPVKITTTKLGFERMFSDEQFTFEGIPTSSDVSDQPKSDNETLTGATNRVNNLSKIAPGADYWVGIEGGIEEKNGEMYAFAWIVIKSNEGTIGKSKTGTFFLPHKVAELIREGQELGDADDIVFGIKNSKRQNGAVGILTGDVITRTSFYEQAVIFALIPFKNKKLY